MALVYLPVFNEFLIVWLLQGFQSSRGGLWLSGEKPGEKISFAYPNNFKACRSILKSKFKSMPPIGTNRNRLYFILFLFYFISLCVIQPSVDPGSQFIVGK